MLYVKLVLMAVFWSGVFPAVSIVLRSMGIFGSVFLRFAAAALILLALLYWKEGRLPRLSPRAIPAWYGHQAWSEATWQGWAALGYLVLWCRRSRWRNRCGCWASRLRRHCLQARGS